MSGYFLPLGLVLALLGSLVSPAPGRLLDQWGLIPWMVVIIFVVNGYQISLRQMPRAGTLLATTFVAVVINLLISPWIGYLLAHWLELPQEAVLGLVVMASVPATLSSGIVMTQLAGGDALVALFLTVLLNLLGVFVLPLTLQMTLGGSDVVELSPWLLLRQLILIVLLPFLLGMWMRRMAWFDVPQPLLKYLPSSCVIGTVWMSLSSSVESIARVDMTLLWQLTLASILVHLLLQLFCWASRRCYRVARAETLALLFTASQKTLPVAIGVLSTMAQPVGVAILVCILFHFLQLFWDAMLAARFARAKG
ncbi:MAG: bile acid:sodium symporter [Gammaproteobacteria bacterium]|nr:bile acid:sodium symporter [Gammaproteobacteria bacterium]